MRRNLHAIRRRALPLLAAPALALPALVAGARPARAQAWPERPVRLLVPFAPGGNTDTLARLTAELLTEAIPGASVAVENRTGVGGVLAAEALARAPADGHTLMMASLSTLAIAPVAAVQRPRFDPVADIAPVVNLATNPFVLIAHRGVGAADLPALLAWMRESSGRFAYASGGVGSMQHLSMALLLTRLGIAAEHVPYRGGAPALLDVLAGTVPVSFANLSEVVPHAANPAIRLLGISSRAASPVLPGVPPIAAALPGFETVTWNGLVAPAGLPGAIAARLHRIVAEGLARPAFRARLAALGAEPLGEGPEPFAARLRADVALWAGVVRQAGVTVE